MQCEEYLERHSKAIMLRKWWCLFKYSAMNKKNGKYIGKILTDEEVKRKIDSHEIISFDIFDTLLLRPYAKPTDLFREIGKYYGDETFYQARIDAERKARKKYYQQEEVTYEQIYGEIEEQHKKYSVIELEWEQKKLYKNKKVEQLYQYALEQKKRIVICSDMYLSSEFLTQVLELNGYRGISDYYVSSECMVTKTSGNLFRYMIDRLQVKPETILHIGDNEWSDGNAYRKYGIEFIGIYKDNKWGYVNI